MIEFVFEMSFLGRELAFHLDRRAVGVLAIQRDQLILERAYEQVLVAVVRVRVEMIDETEKAQLLVEHLDWHEKRH